jgi:class 3 adenylate cyclase
VAQDNFWLELLKVLADGMAAASESAVRAKIGSEDWLARHAPARLKEIHNLHTIASRIQDGQETQLIVLSVDIRRSTMLMKEAISAKEHASILNQFIERASQAVRALDGWFDKFMGDGFLAYWVCEPGYEAAAVARALAASRQVQEAFASSCLPRFKANSRNWPAEVGISSGLDAGPGHLVVMADGLTIIGAPIVGAVRMVSTAQGGEAVANVQFQRMMAAARHPGVRVVNEERKTKEYANQLVAVLHFDGTPPPLPAWPMPLPPPPTPPAKQLPTGGR